MDVLHSFSLLLRCVPVPVARIYTQFDQRYLSLLQNGNPFYPLVSQDTHGQDILPSVVGPDARPLPPFNHEPHLFIHRDGSLIACKHGQRQPLQSDPSKRILDDECRRFGTIAAVPKPRQETDTERPVTMLSFGYVNHELAHERACGSVSDDETDHGGLHLCAE